MLYASFLSYTSLLYVVSVLTKFHAHACGCNIPSALANIARHMCTLCSRKSAVKLQVTLSSGHQQALSRPTSILHEYS